MSTLPFTAWEQAVFVCLLIALVGGLLAWLSKQMRDWQTFIAGLEEKWRQFLKDERMVYSQSRREDNLRMERIELALDRLAGDTAQFRADFNTHATEEMTRYETIIELTKTNSARRGKV